MNHRGPQRTIRVYWNGEGYLVGNVQGPWLAVLRSIKRSLNIKWSASIGYFEPDGSFIHINNDEDLNRADRSQNHHLRLFLDLDQPPPTPPKQFTLLKLEKAYKSLKSIFSVTLNGEFKGLGMLVTLKLALTSITVLKSTSDVTSALIFFEDSISPLKINPASVFVVSETLIFFSFISAFEISELEELNLTPAPLSSYSTAIVLCNNPSHDFIEKIRQVSLVLTSRIRLQFESESIGSAAGSPVFTDNWELIGIQITAFSHLNEVIACCEILSGLKQLPFDYRVVRLIQAIQPAQEFRLEYEEAVLVGPVEDTRVFGVAADRNSIIAFNVKTGKEFLIAAQEKISEGASICVFPNGLFLSGGKYSLQKAFVLFFDGLSQWFLIELPQAHTTHASVYLKKRIYLIGGKNSVRAINNCEAFDYQSRKFETLKGLRYNRSSPAAIAFKNTIYVFGGDSGEQDLDTIEYYEDERWRIHVLKMPLRLFGMACLGLNDAQVILFGGLNRKVKFNLKVVVMDFGSQKARIEDTEERVGVCNGMQVCENDTAAFVYNFSAELMMFSKGSGKIAKQKNQVISGFVND